MKHPFTGTGAALVTPFREDFTVNFALFDRLIDFQLENGTDAVVVCGTTGEGATLTIKERMALFQRTADRINGRVPLICGTGSNSTSFCLETAKEAENRGADYHLIVTPYYNKTSQQGLLRHYFTLADALQKPVIVYNVPSRTGCSIQPTTYAALAEHPNIQGIKEAGGDISQIATTMALCRGKLDLYSGNDDQILPLMALGGKGCISVLSNVMPAESHEITARFFAGDVAEAAALQLDLLPLIHALFSEVNPIPVKAAMAAMGFCADIVRAPLTPMEDEHREVLYRLMHEKGLIL